VAATKIPASEVMAIATQDTIILRIVALLGFIQRIRVAETLNNG
jgi:hypothetical protein